MTTLWRVDAGSSAARNRRAMRAPHSIWRPCSVQPPTPSSSRLAGPLHAVYGLEPSLCTASTPGILEPLGDRCWMLPLRPGPSRPRIRDRRSPQTSVLTIHEQYGGVLAEPELFLFGKRVENMVAVDQERVAVRQSQSEMASLAFDRLDAHQLAACRHAMVHTATLPGQRPGQGHTFRRELASEDGHLCRFRALGARGMRANPHALFGACSCPFGLGITSACAACADNPARFSPMGAHQVLRRHARTVRCAGL